jgi:hypothetical protein
VIALRCCRCGTPTVTYKADAELNRPGFCSPCWNLLVTTGYRFPHGSCPTASHVHGVPITAAARAALSEVRA